MGPWPIRALSVVLSLGVMCAQGPTSGSISGAVTDATGGVLPSVKVTVTSPALLGGQSTLTNEQGIYRFPSLPPGVYRLAFEQPGFASVVREGIQVNIGFSDVINVAMNVASQQQSVLVTGESPLVDTQNTNIQNNFTAQMLRNLPNARDIWSLIAEAPGLTVTRFDVGGSTAGTQTTYYAYGLTGQNRVQLDGVNTTEGTNAAGFYFDYGAFQELQLGTAANDASMPNPGVLLNAVLKSGGNQFHGDAYFDYENERLQGTNIDESQRRKGAGAGTRITGYWDPNFNLGGPIKRDRVWFFTSLRNQQIANTVTGFPANAPGTGPDFLTRLQNITYKTSAQLTPKNRLSHYLQWGRKYQPYRDADSSAYRDAVYRQNSFSWASNLEWSSVLSPKFFLDARLSTFGYNWPNYPYPGPSGKIEYRRVENQSGNRAGGYDEYRYNRRRYQGEVTSNYFLDNWLGANHSLKFGYLSEREGLAYEQYGNLDNLLLTFNSPPGAPDFAKPFQVTLYNEPAIQHDFLWHHGAYLQDQIKLGRRVMANAGVRWDYYNAYEPEQRLRADAPYRDFFYAGKPLPNGFSIAPIFPDFRVPANHHVLHYPRAIVPRLGLAWDLRGNGNTVLKFNWGRFYSNPATAIGSNVNPIQKTGFTFLWDDLNGDRLFQPDELGAFVSSSGGANFTVDPHIGHPVSDDAGAYLERRIANDLSLRVGFVYKRLNRDWQLVEVARAASLYTAQVPAFDPGPDGVPGTADDRGPLTVWDIPSGTPVPPSRKVYQTPRDNTQEYKNIEITVNKRMAQRWGFIANYYYDWGFYLLNGHPTNPNEAFHNDVHITNWAAKFIGTYQAPWGFLVSPILRRQSGVPLPRNVLVTGLRAGTFSDPVEPVGAYRQDNVTLFDTRVEKVLSFGESKRLGLFLDAFNVFNTNAAQDQDPVTGRRSVVLNGQRIEYQRFLRPVTVVGPRIFRLGVRFSF